MTSKRQKKSGHLIPANHLPADNACMRVYYPADPLYKAALIGTIAQLGKWWTWERDEQKRAREVAERWRLALHLLDDTCGGSEEMECCDKVSFIYNQIVFANKTTLIDQSQALYNAWQNTTNITEINEYVTNVYGAEQSEPNLCYAAIELVAAQKELLAAARQVEGDVAGQIASLIVAAAAGLTLLLAPPVAALAVAAGGLTAVLANTGLTSWSVQQIRDADTQQIANAIFCRLNNTSTAYASCALEATAIELSGVEAFIYQRIAMQFNAPPGNEKLRFWQSWVNYLGESRRVGKEANICACVQSYSTVINFDSVMPNLITKGSIASGQGRDSTAALLTDFTLASTRDFTADFIVNLPSNAKLKRVAFWIRRTGNLQDIRFFTMNGATNAIIVSHGNVSGASNAWTYRQYTYSDVPVSQLRLRWSYAAVLNSSFTMWHYIDNVEIDWEA